MRKSLKVFCAILVDIFYLIYLFTWIGFNLPVSPQEYIIAILFQIGIFGEIIRRNSKKS